MGLPKFARPRGGDGQASPNLYVANCGPAVGLSISSIASAFSVYGEVTGVYAADESGTRVIVSYSEVGSAQSALKALGGHPCAALGDRLLHIRYSVQQPSSKAIDLVPVSRTASELNIPGLYLVPDFVTAEDEENLLTLTDTKAWRSLAKRRVQHYGYEFCYDTRNVNTRQQLGQLPSFVSPILRKMSLFNALDEAAEVVLDQLTINEYPPGVGLSPHIDTHSAFEGSIYSLSLAGPCIMEFRKYPEGIWLSKPTPCDNEVEMDDKTSNVLKRAVYLPPRSMLLLSGEARYAWHHYIPHHKVDIVNDAVIRRGKRRVSFTFRKVREGPCQCEFPQYCDSQR